MEACWSAGGRTPTQTPSWAKRPTSCPGTDSPGSQPTLKDYCGQGVSGKQETNGSVCLLSSTLLVPGVILGGGTVPITTKKGFPVLCSEGGSEPNKVDWKETKILAFFAILCLRTTAGAQEAHTT